MAYKKSRAVDIKVALKKIKEYNASLTPEGNCTFVLLNGRRGARENLWHQRSEAVCNRAVDMGSSQLGRPKEKERAASDNHVLVLAQLSMRVRSLFFETSHRDTISEAEKDSSQLRLE